MSSRRRRRCRRAVTGSVSAIGTAMAGSTSPSASATELTSENGSKARPKSRPGLLFCELARAFDRAQHGFARPAIDLQSRRFLIGAERRARQHASLAVELVLVETDAREVTLHR